MILTHGANSIGGGGIPTEVTIGEHTYPVVQIGNQLWTAENLIYLPNGIAFTSNSSFTDAPEAAQYNNQSGYNYCGLIYNGNCVSILNAVLPTGWHIPYKADYINLIATYGIDNLCASTLWNPPGANGTNLSIYPYGFRGKGSNANAFDGYGYQVRYLTSDNVGGTNAYGMINLTINSYDAPNVWYHWGGYVRIVKNLT
jgi:uncharacterized protein (TIGR02145 family)